MKTILPLLLINLLFCISCSTTWQPSSKSNSHNSPRILEGIYNTDGAFALVQAIAGIVEQEPGVFINVYFTKESGGGSGSLDFNVLGGTMMLALYTSQTIVTMNQCQDFIDFNCTKYNCVEHNDQPASIVLPYFEAIGNYGTGYLTFDANYWNYTQNYIVAHDCPPYRGVDYGNKTVGIIGLGVRDNNLKNFVTSKTYDSILGGSESVAGNAHPVFSFFVTADGYSGTLYFKIDTSKTTTTTPVYTLTATQDWHVPNVTAIKVGRLSTTFAEDTNLIFDINSRSLGLPLNIYTQVIAAIDASLTTLVCPTGVESRPTCTYTGQVSALPQILLTIGGQVIAIPPSAYVEEVGEIDELRDKIVLNIMGTSNKTGPTYVTEDYENYVILGQQVMGYYYTAFDTTINSKTGMVQIKMFVANHGTRKWALLIVLGGIVLGVIIGLGIWKWRKEQKLKKQQEEGHRLLGNDGITGYGDNHTEMGVLRR